MHTLTPEVLRSVILSLVVVIGAALAGGALFRLMRQPPVVGEILAGIALGPSLLGALVPGATEAIVPLEVRPYLSLVSQLGLVVFMLLVGLEVSFAGLRSRAKALAGVSAGSLLLPFGLGVGAALVLPAAWRGDSTTGVFAVFLGTALAVTAFPVLARILRDRRMGATPVGSMALGAAAVTDVVAWTLVALTVSLATSEGRPSWQVVTLGALFAAVLLVGVRPVLQHLHERGVLDRVSPRNLVVGVVVLALLCAWVTSTIGLHEIFGPFLLGLALPRHPLVVDVLETRLEDVSTGVLLPAFFVVAGLSVDLTSLGADGMLVLALLLGVAVFGKVVGTLVPARVSGMGTRDSLRLGALLSTRGLTELVVLSIGFQAGILTSRLYTILVAVALLTTLATGPLLALFDRLPLEDRPDEVTPPSGEENTTDTTITRSIA